MTEKKRFGWFRRQDKKPSAQSPSVQQPQAKTPVSSSSHFGEPKTTSALNPSSPKHGVNPKNFHHKQAVRQNSHKDNGDKKMRIIPLGGLEEVGKNCMGIEYENDMLLIDAGLSFADGDMLGVDYIIPDTTYVEQRKRKLKAIIFTHAHLDHIGAVQHVLPKLGNPLILATKLAAGLIMNRLKEFGLDKSANIRIYDENTKIRLGSFEVEFFNVNHSIPEGKGVYVKCPAGSLVHTGDFKFDHSPAIDKPVDFQRIAEIGKKGVDLLFSDSTNSMKKGFCISENEIGKNLEDIIEKTKGRIIIASFASLIGRLNQICNFAAKNGRQVFASGRSMVENLKLAENLGYTTYPKGIVRKIGPEVDKMPPSKVLIVTTGAQGESLSALTRMALGEHKQIKIKPADTVIISATPIPGNETAVVNVINNLYMLGANVVTNRDMDIHVSGHACQEELKIMYRLIQPKCLIPIHGEWFMRKIHENVIRDIDPTLQSKILENGDILTIGRDGIRKSKEKIPANDIVIDGLGFGNIGSKVLQQRKQMANDGVVVLLFKAYEKSKNLIGEPHIDSSGFLYIKELEGLSEEIKKVANRAFEQIVQKNRDIHTTKLKEEIKLYVDRFIYKRLRRSPEIIPMISYV